MNHLLRRIPLRVKLITVVLALVSVALVVISVSSVVALRGYLIDRVDADLRQVAASVNYTVLTGENRLWVPPDFYVTISDGAGWQKGQGPDGMDQADLPKLPPVGSVQLGQITTVGTPDGGGHWRVLATGLPGDQSLRLLVAKDLSDVNYAISRLVWIDVLVGSSVLILLAGIGVAIVRRSLRPLTDIERTAAAIGQGDLTKRVPDFEGAGDGPPRTEVGRLSRALNAMLAQIEVAFTARAASETAARAAEFGARDAALAAQVSESRARRSEERMRQFVADASHELRTPLTTIRGFAELYRQAARSASRGNCAACRFRSW